MGTGAGTQLFGSRQWIGYKQHSLLFAYLIFLNYILCRLICLLKNSTLVILQNIIILFLSIIKAGYMAILKTPFRGFRTVSLFFCLIAFLVNPSNSLADYTVNDVVTASMLLADESTFKKGFDALKKIISDNNQAVSYSARATLAAYFRNQNDLKNAALLAKNCRQTAGYSDLHPAVAVQYLRCLLEAAHVLVLQEKITEALPLLNWAETRPRDYDRALSCTKYAEILIEMKEVDRAEAYCKKVKESCRKYFSHRTDSGTAIGQGSTGLDVSSVWHGLQRRVDLLDAGIQSQRMNEKFGEEYGLYVKMRMYMDKGHYRQASGIAEQVMKMASKSIFAAAAGYSYGVCLLNDRYESDEKIRIQNMMRWMQKFINQDPNGLYRGEAYLLIGKTAMVKALDPKHALEYYTLALDYFVKAREKANALSLYTPVASELQEYTRPQQRLTTYNMWLRTERHAQVPKKLYNTSSAPPWYRNEQEKKCHLAIGFLLFNASRFDEAKEHWSKIMSLDDGLQAMNPRMPNAYKRLQFACDHKYLVLRASEKEKIKSPAVRLKFTYAEYQCVIE